MRNGERRGRSTITSEATTISGAAATSAASTTWVPRRTSARALGAIVALCPPVAALVVAVLLGRALGPGDGTGRALGRLPLLAVAAIAVHLLVRRAVRRLAPLATLLRLSIVFPDRSPSRFAVALRANQAHRLHRRVTAAATHAR
ncbi:MAG: hypothetical protein GEV08_07865, partial [Acidimicrobiia bacterium]|nr:hypothetical protein [Acidimicrobiia bacterium]